MQREFSYPVLKAILPKVPYDARSYLSLHSRSVRTIHKTIDISFSRVRFHNKLGENRDCLSEKCPHPSATLSVDNVTYQFIYDEVTELVEIRCSLAPHRSKRTCDKWSAIKYFRYFIQFPFDLLDLKECCYPFHYRNVGFKPNCRSLRWDCKGKYYYSLNHTSPIGNCFFDKVELYNMGDAGHFSIAACVRQAKHVVINSDFCADQRYSDEELHSRFVLSFHKNQLIQFTLKIYCVLPFTYFCTHLLHNNLDIGSFYKAVFFKRNGLKQKIIEQLCNRFPDVTLVSDGDGQLLAILESNDEFRVEVKWESNEDDDHETFIAIKEEVLSSDN